MQLGLSAVWTGMRSRRLPLERLAEWMSAAPARLLGLSARKGAIAPGHDADFVGWMPDEEFIVTAHQLLQRHPITPYLGARLSGVVHSTWVRGTCVYNRREGVTGVHGRLITREAVHT
jgi:allantoinase